MFEARDTRLGRPVAIKLLLRSASEERAQKRFAREARALAKLKHPNVVAVHDVGDLQGRPYLVMEFVPGRSLQERLEREGPLPWDQAARLIEQLAEGLEQAHALQLLHRDVKPANVLLDEDGRARLTDFGLAKDLDPELDGTAVSRGGCYMGTPGYWPPEQARGRLEDMGPPSDVYGLGATWYALLTGAPPFGGQTVLEVVEATCTQSPTAPSKQGAELPPALERVLLRCLAKAPGDRYPTAGALAEAIAAARRAPTPQARGRLGALIAASVLLAVAIGYWAGTRPPVQVQTASPTPSSPPPPPRPATPTPSVDPAAELIAQATARGRAGDLGAALELCDKALAISPDDPRVYHARGVAWLYQGEGDRALEAFELAAIKDPTWAAPLVMRAEVFHGVGAVEEALDEVERARQVDPEDAAVYATRGAIRLGLGDDPAAEADFGRALELDPDCASALHGRGVLRLDRDDLDGARADLDRVLELEPGNLGARVARAKLRRTHFGDYEGALADLAAALERSPQQPDLLHERGRVWLELEEPQKAYDDFSAAIEADPNFWAPRSQRALLLVRLGRDAAAWPDLQELVRRGPFTRSIWLAHADVAQALREPLEARRSLERLLENDAQDVAVLIRLCDLYLGFGETERTFSTADTILALDPTLSAAHAARALAHELEGNLLGALHEIDRAIELSPDEASVLTHRARLRMRDADLDGALADLDRAEAADSAFLETVLMRARILARQGQVAEALAKVTALEADMPDEPWVLLAKAQVLLRAEQLDEATQAISRAVGTKYGDQRFLNEVEAFIERLSRALKLRRGIDPDAEPEQSDPAPTPDDEPSPTPNGDG